MKKTKMRKLCGTILAAAMAPRHLALSAARTGKAHQASHEVVKAGDEFVVDYVRVYDLVQ